MKPKSIAARAARRGGLPLLLSFLCTGPVWAAAPSAGAQEVPSRTLEEVLGSTLRTNETMAIASESVTQAGLARRRALFRLTPDLTLSAFRQRLGSSSESDGAEGGGGEEGTGFPGEGNWMGYNLAFTQPLFTGGRALAAYRGAGDQTEALMIQEELVRRDLLVSASEAYFGVLAAMETVRIGEQAVVRAERHLDLAKRRLELGEGIVTDRLRAEVNLAEVTGNLTRFRNLLADARDRVERISGRPLAETPAAVNPLVDIASGVDSLVDEALSARLERKQDRLGIAAAEEDVREKKGRFFPLLFFRANLYSNGESFDDQEDGWDAGVFLELPLYQSAERHFLLKESKSSLRQAELRNEGRARDIALEVSRLYNALVASRTQVVTLRKQVELAGENLRLAEKRFSVGLADSLETVDTQTALLEAEVNLTAEVLTFEVAKLRLLRALGREIYPEISFSSVLKTRSR